MAQVYVVRLHVSTDLCINHFLLLNLPQQMRTESQIRSLEINNMPSRLSQPVEVDVIVVRSVVHAVLW